MGHAAGAEKKLETPRDRHRRLMEVAARLICEKGYEGTSIQDIAAAGGLTKAGLYHYIHGKTQLLFDIMQYGLDELEREVAEPAKKIADPEQRLRFMIGTHARIVTRGHGAVTILVDEARALTPAQNRHIARRKRAYLDFLRATLEELKKQGKLRDVSITVAAFGILGTINWLSRWVKPGGTLDENEIADQIIDVAFNGVTRPARRGLRAI